MHTPPRAFVALAVVTSLVATALPLNLRAPFGASGGGLAPGVANATILQQFSTDGLAPIAPGVQRTWGRIVTGSGQQVINLLQVQPGAPGITFQAALSNDTVVGLERPSSTANRQSLEGHRAVAVINGDVWSNSGNGANAAPFGVHIQDAELMVAGQIGRPTFGIDQAGLPIIGAPIVSVNAITADTAIHPINRINQHRNAGEYVLYTPRFGAATGADASGTEVVLTGVPLPLRSTVNVLAIVAAVRLASGGRPIDPGTVILSGPENSFLTSLAPGQPVQLTISITAGWENVTQAIGGREFLLRNGATFISPHPAIADQHHPRTAVGVTAGRGVILATVDGRDIGRSTGVTDSELSALLAEQGAVDAINLDGGGSTAMAVRQPGDTFVSVVNRASDGAERSVANSLVIYSAAPTGPLAIVTLTPAGQSIYATQSIALRLIGQDAAYNPVVVDPASVSWSVSGATGTFDATGRFTATGPGTAQITATTAGISGSVALTVLADTTPPVVAAPIARLLAGTQLQKTVPVFVSWPAASDVGIGVASFELQQNLNGKAWKTAPSGSPLNRSSALSLARNSNERYAVRAADGAGNVSAFALAPSFRVTVLSEASSSIAYHGNWSRITSPSYDGKAAMSTRTPGAFAVYSFVGSAFAWVAARSPVRGSARVFVDGDLAGTINLFSSTSVVRTLVFTKFWPKSGRHVVKIVADGTTGHPRVDIDALIVLGPARVTIQPPKATAPPPPPSPTPSPTPSPKPSPTPKPPSGSPSPSPSPTPSPSGSSGSQVIVGAGNIASCTSTADTATGKLIAGISGTVFTTGDNAYESGTADEFSTCYGPAWGAAKSRTRPVPGARDYDTLDATGYFGYFGPAAGAQNQGWYAYDLGSWRIYAINSNCADVGGCGAGSQQESWLLADLAANPRQCVMAYWSHPRFSSGAGGGDLEMDAIWQDLAAAGADLVVNGHDQDYERFAPLSATGETDPATGMREFIVGTGGARLGSFGAVLPTSEIRNNATFGVLKLTLGPSGYNWQFVSIAGQTFTDTGSSVCH